MSSSAGSSVPDTGVLLADSPAGIGPLGGLRALLLHAGDAAGDRVGVRHAVRVGRAARAAGARNVCRAGARRRAIARAANGKRCARATTARVSCRRSSARSQRGERSFQGWLRDVHVEPFALEPGEDAQLRDWDEPGDVAAG